MYTTLTKPKPPLDKKINIALVGTGFWGKNLLRNFYLLNAVTIICDSSEDVLQEESKKYPDLKTTVSFTDALASPEINAVVIATPAEQHFPMAKDALLAGKHVFVEKPLAITKEEGETLVELASSKQRVLFVGHILQYHPAITQLKKMLQEGKLGKLQYIYSNRLNLGKIRREENILWSFAPHDISVILSLLNEEPQEVTAVGTNILHPEIADTTMTNLKFSSGIGGHIFVSWLHPFKEQKLVIIGDRNMVVFDDMNPIERKLVMYPHNIIWKHGIPVPQKGEGKPIDISQTWEEPLAIECRAFLDAINGKPCITNGQEGLRVLSVLQRAQKSMDQAEKRHTLENYFAHETCIVDEGCQIGAGSKIWHFSHILKGSRLGDEVTIGQNVVIGPNAQIGNHVKIQNNVSIYEGVILEDDVFCGPSCVFTNVINPRSAIPRKHEFQSTRVCRGATLGANATILCGVTIGKYAFIGAGAVVTKDVLDHALVYGNPAEIQGWVCECGCRLDETRKCGPCGKTIPKP